MTLTKLGAAALCAALMMPLIAQAGPWTASDGPAAGAGALVGGGVVLPWGAYVSAVLGWLMPVAVSLASAIVAYACRELPSWAVALIKENLTQARIQRAVGWAVTQIDGAVKGKTLSVEASNDLLAMAENYMLSFAPQIAAQLGDRLRPMLLAEIAKIGVAPAERIYSPLPAKPLPQINK